MKNFVRNILALTILLNNNSLLAQLIPPVQWQKSLGGSKDEKASSLLQIINGGYIVAGTTISNDDDVSGWHVGYDNFSNPLSDFWIVRVDTLQNIVWQKCLGGSGQDAPSAIQQTNDGNFIVAGTSSSMNGDVTGNHGLEDGWIVKLDTSGNLIWQKTFGGSGYDGFYAISSTSDGGFILAGYSTSNDGDVSGNHGGWDMWVVKIDSVGSLLWQKSLGGSNWDDAYSIQQTVDGGFIVAGSSYSSDGDVSENKGLRDCWIVKLDASGNLEWQKSYGGSDYEVVSSIQQIPDGGFIVAAASQSFDGDVIGNHGADDFWILKLDSAGSLIWQKTLGGNLGDLPFSLWQSDDGGFIIAGTSASNNGDVSGNHGSFDYWIVNLDSTGNLIWQESYGGSNYDVAYAIQPTTDGGLLVAGVSYSDNYDVSGNHGSDDYWVAKLFCQAQYFYLDADGDGFGGAIDTFACQAPYNYVTNNLDCNDSVTNANPLAHEFYNGIDDDCNGLIDDNISFTPCPEWKKCFGGTEFDDAFCIRNTLDGGSIIAGISWSNNGDVSGQHGTGDYWIVKLHSDGTIDWQKLLGGSGNDPAESIVQTADGNYVVVGSCYSNDGDVSGNHGLNDDWVVMLDSSGNVLSKKCLGGSLNDAGTSIEKTADGGFIIAGNSTSNDGDVSDNHGATDFWIVKLNSSIDIDWQKSLGGSDTDWPGSIQQTSDGGYIVAGYSNSIDGDVTINHGLYDYWIVRLDQGGNLVWQKSFGGSGNDHANSIRQIPGGYIVAGMTQSTDGDVTENKGWSDAWFLKLDTSGNLIWQKSFGGSGFDGASAIQLTGNNEYVMSGYSGSHDGDVSGNQGNSDMWVARFDSSGNIDWQYSYGGSMIEGASGDNTIELTSSGEYTLVGATDSNDGDVSGNHGGTDYWIIKLAANLQQLLYADADSDGYGNPNDSIVTCATLPGYIANKLDCNDTNPNVHPGAFEIPNNGIDDDCDGIIDECSVSFTLIADSLVPHHYWLFSNVGGVPPINYLWNWGDGTTDTSAYPSHTYDSAGFYNICLTIVDSTGCTDSSCVDYDLQKSEEMNLIITVDVVDSIPDIATGILNENILQSLSVYPNPASENVFASYSLSSPAIVTIELYDVLGNKLKEISNDVDAGEHRTVIDTREFSNGVYYLKIQAGEQIVSRKIVVIK